MATDISKASRDDAVYALTRVDRLNRLAMICKYKSCCGRDVIQSFRTLTGIVGALRNRIAAEPQSSSMTATRNSHIQLNYSR